jgi:hypothetical protein
VRATDFDSDESGQKAVAPHPASTTSAMEFGARAGVAALALVAAAAAAAELEAAGNIIEEEAEAGLSAAEAGGEGGNKSAGDGETAGSGTGEAAAAGVGDCACTKAKFDSLECAVFVAAVAVAPVVGEGSSAIDVADEGGRTRAEGLSVACASACAAVAAGFVAAAESIGSRMLRMRP